MKTKPAFVLASFLILAGSLNLGMARQGQYDEEARQAEREEKRLQKLEKQKDKNPTKNFVGGVKQATVDGAAGLLAETADSTTEDAPIVGTVEGVRKGSEALLDNTVRGAVKVATLGYGEAGNYEIEEPEAGTDETTKIKIKIPGT